MTTDELLTPKEVGAILRLTERTILNMIDRGVLVGHEITPKAWRVTRASVEEHLRKTRRPPSEEPPGSV